MLLYHCSSVLLYVITLLSVCLQVDLLYLSLSIFVSYWPTEHSHYGAGCLWLTCINHSFVYHHRRPQKLIRCSAQWCRPNACHSLCPGSNREASVIIVGLQLICVLPYPLVYSIRPNVMSTMIQISSLLDRCDTPPQSDSRSAWLGVCEA